MTTGEGALTAHLEWLRLRGLREATITQRAYAVRRLARALGTDLLLASEADLKKWRLSLAHLAPVTVCTEVMHVHQFFVFCHDEGWVPTVPTRRLVRPKKPPRLPRPISEADLEMAVRLAPRHIRPWFVLAGWAGMRAGEIARLQRQDVLDTADPPVIHITESKGGGQRIVPIGQTVLRELHAYGMPSRGFVFPRLDGQPGGNSPARVSQAANRFLREIGVSAVFHQCRHRAGTQLYRVSRDLRMVSGVLGHRDTSTTCGYVAWSDQAAVDAVLALDGLGLAAGT